MENLLHDESLLVKARMVTLLHTMLYNGRYHSVVTNYLHRPIELENTSSTVCHCTQVVALVLCVTTLPYVYAWFLMPYPCASKRVLQDSLTHVQQEIDCSSQDFLRKPWSLIYGPSAAMLYGVFVLCTALVDKFTLGSGLTIRLGVGFQLRQKCKSKIYGLVGERIWKLRFHSPRLGTAGQGLYAFVAHVYFTILVPMAFVAMIEGSVVALVVGVALAEILLKFASTFMAPSAKQIAQITGQLACFPLLTPGFLLQLASQPGPVVYVSAADLQAIYEHPELSELRGEAAGIQGYHWFTAADLTSFDRVPWHVYEAPYIYVPEWNRVISCAGAKSQ